MANEDNKTFLRNLDVRMTACPFKFNDDRTRTLLKHGALMKLNPQNQTWQRRYFFLFNDMLLWSKEKKKAATSTQDLNFLYRGHLNLNGALLNKAVNPSSLGRKKSDKKAADLVFQVVRMDVDQKVYILKASNFTDWYDWTTLIEERVDTFLMGERQKHERIIAGLLTKERRKEIATGVNRLSMPIRESFVELCESLVASEKDYADDLDTMLQQYWIPLCIEGVLHPTFEVPRLFGNVEKIALAHVEILSKLEDSKIDTKVMQQYGLFAAETKLICEQLVAVNAKSGDTIHQLYTAYASDIEVRLAYFDTLLETRPEFVKFVQKKNRSLPAHSSINRLLCRPLDRLQQYVNLADRIRRCCPQSFISLIEYVSQKYSAALGDKGALLMRTPRPVAATSSSSSANDKQATSSKEPDAEPLDLLAALKMPPPPEVVAASSRRRASLAQGLGARRATTSPASHKPAVDVDKLKRSPMSDNSSKLTPPADDSDPHGDSPMDLLAALKMSPPRHDDDDANNNAAAKSPKGSKIKRRMPRRMSLTLRSTRRDDADHQKRPTVSAKNTPNKPSLSSLSLRPGGIKGRAQDDQQQRTTVWDVANSPLNSAGNRFSQTLQPSSKQQRAGQFGIGSENDSGGGTMSVSASTTTKSTAVMNDSDATSDTLLITTASSVSLLSPLRAPSSASPQLAPGDDGVRRTSSNPDQSERASNRAASDTEDQPQRAFSSDLRQTSYASAVGEQDNNNNNNDDENDDDDDQANNGDDADHSDDQANGLTSPGGSSSSKRSRTLRRRRVKRSTSKDKPTTATTKTTDKNEVNGGTAASSQSNSNNNNNNNNASDSSDSSDRLHLEPRFSVVDVAGTPSTNSSPYVALPEPERDLDAESDGEDTRTTPHASGHYSMSRDSTSSQQFDNQGGFTGSREIDMEEELPSTASPCSSTSSSGAHRSSDVVDSSSSGTVRYRSASPQLRKSRSDQSTTAKKATPAERRTPRGARSETTTPNVSAKSLLVFDPLRMSQMQHVAKRRSVDIISSSSRKAAATAALAGRNSPRHSSTNSTNNGSNTRATPVKPTSARRLERRVAHLEECNEALIMFTQQLQRELHELRDQLSDVRHESRLVASEQQRSAFALDLMLDGDHPLLRRSTTASQNDADDDDDDNNADNGATTDNDDDDNNADDGAKATHKVLQRRAHTSVRRSAKLKRSTIQIDKARLAASDNHNKHQLTLEKSNSSNEPMDISKPYVIE